MRLTYSRTAALAAVLAAVALVLIGQAAAGPPWGPETPPFNLEVILRDAGGGSGFGHVAFRQPNDADRFVYLDTWVRDLVPNHDYQLQRAVDTTLDEECTGTGWLTLGKLTTDDRGTGRAPLSRNLGGFAPGTQFDIDFRVVDAATGAAVLTSGCYRFTVTQ